MVLHKVHDGMKATVNGSSVVIGLTEVLPQWSLLVAGDRKSKIQEIHKTTARYITLTLLFLSLFSAPIVQAQVRGTETIIVYRYEKFSAKQLNSSMAYLRKFYTKVKYGGELTL